MTNDEKYYLQTLLFFIEENADAFEFYCDDQADNQNVDEEIIAWLRKVSGSEGCAS
jgi:hypothetical protein